VSVRCDCPYFDPEPGVKDVCDCGHTDDEHETGGGPCMWPLLDPAERAGRLSALMQERFGSGGGR